MIINGGRPSRSDKMMLGGSKVVRRLSQRIALSFVVPGLLLWAPANAVAQPREQGGRGSSKEVRPLDQLLPVIRLSHPGKLLDAHGPTSSPSGAQHYQLKWITPKGEVSWLDADAQSGQVLGRSSGPDSFYDH